MSQKLSDKVALVTGGTSGIGLAMENLSPTRREALNSPPSLQGKEEAGGLGFPHDVKSQAEEKDASVEKPLH